MSNEILELAFVLSAAAGLGLIARLLRQPLILAYIGTGVVIGLFGLTPVATDPIYKIFADLGIMFLLFLIGLEINLPSLRRVGKVAVVIGLGQIVFTAVGGFLIALLLGFDLLPAAYIAITLTFSSTIIIIKLLSEKGDLNSLYGKISVGFLLVQDFVAIIILLALAGVQTGGAIDWGVLGFTLIKGLGLLALMAWLGRSIMPWIFDRIAKSQELLFITALAWVFLVVALVNKVGFSIEIGGFLAGLALANSSEHFLITARVKPLRDFFLVLFFVVLGTSVAQANLTGIGWPVIVFSLFVLIGNPLIVMAIMGGMGYHRRTSFLAGVTVAQISEFSLVVAALGFKVGHITNDIVTIITAVGVITITLSSYLIIYADRLYGWWQEWLRFFERRHTKPDRPMTQRFRREIILIGADRTGRNLLHGLVKSDVVVIDFNPDIVTALRREKYAAIYGDINDPDLDEQIDFSAARIVVCTSPDPEDSIHLLQFLSAEKVGVPVIARAETPTDAAVLYQAGAAYVFMPHMSAGRHLHQVLTKKFDRQVMKQLRKEDERLLHAVQKV